MEAAFTQTVTNDKNNTLLYSGYMYAKEPYKTFWHYKKPFEKSLYISGDKITIVQPDLEQAIVKTLDENINILAILRSAQKMKNGHYLARYNENRYEIVLEKKMIKSIHYKTPFDHQVVITFTDPKVNQVIDNQIFKAQIPDDFDIISE